MVNEREEMQDAVDRRPTDQTWLTLTYQILASRRLGYDTLMWQAPALGLTAQAFLFTVALSADSSRTARLVASFLALVTSVISIQLVSKHRHHEMIDSLSLQDMEEKHGWDPIHEHPAKRAKQKGVSRNWFVALSSYRVWILGLASFGLAAILVIAITLVKPGMLR